MPVTEFQLWRELQGAEEHVAFKEIDNDLEISSRRIARALLSAQELWAGELLDRMEDAFSEGPAAIDEATRITPSMTRMIVTLIVREQRTLHTLGENHVQRELDLQQPLQLVRTEPPQVKEVVELFRARAQMGVDRFAKDTEGVVRSSAMDAYRTFGNEITPVEIESMLAEALDVSGRQTQLVSRTLTAESFNMGRDRRARLHRDVISDVQYSALLDSTTCESCTERDGFITDMDSPEYYEYMPPNHECVSRKGRRGNRCRCMWIYRRFDEDSVLPDHEAMFPTSSEPQGTRRTRRSGGNAPWVSSSKRRMDADEEGDDAVDTILDMSDVELIQLVDSDESATVRDKASLSALRGFLTARLAQDLNDTGLNRAALQDATAELTNEIELHQTSRRLLDDNSFQLAMRVANEIGPNKAVQDAKRINVEMPEGTPPISRVRIEDAVRFVETMLPDAFPEVQLDFKVRKSVRIGVDHLTDNRWRILISDRTSVSGVIHALGHVIEHAATGRDGYARNEAVVEWLQSRMTNRNGIVEKARSVNSMSSGSHDESEVGRLGRFPEVYRQLGYSPQAANILGVYAGKQYANRPSTEVVAMGLQLLWHYPIRFAEVDRDWLKMTVGVLAGRHT